MVGEARSQPNILKNFLGALYSGIGPLTHVQGGPSTSRLPSHRERLHMGDQGRAGAVHRQGGLGSHLGRAMGCPGCVAALALRRDPEVLAGAVSWRRDGREGRTS